MFLYNKSWDELLRVYNGWIWHENADVGPHYISEQEEGTQLGSIAWLRTEGSRVLAFVPFRGLPCRPFKGKWTKLGPAVDWWMTAIGLMNALRKLWNIAFRRFIVTVIKKTGGDEPDLIQDFDWHYIRNKRAAYLSPLLTERMVLSLTILALVLEPLRYITKWFLRRGSSYRRNWHQKSGRAT